MTHALQDHIDFQQLGIVVENRKGSVRKGVGSDGREWRTRMLYPYGYIEGTKAKDGEEVDCYVGPVRDAPTAYVVHQHKENGKGFDEDKVMLGFRNLADARAAYLKHYADSKFLGPISAVPMERLKELVMSGKQLDKISQVSWEAMREELQKCASDQLKNIAITAGLMLPAFAGVSGGMWLGLGEKNRTRIRKELHDPRLYSNLRGAFESDQDRIAAHKLLTKGQRDSVWQAMKEGFGRRKHAEQSQKCASHAVQQKINERQARTAASVRTAQKWDRVLGGSLAVGVPLLSAVTYGLLEQRHREKKAVEQLRGGKADNMPDEVFDARQLAMGRKIEREHTDDARLANEIAKDHLQEIPDYYTRLKRMEAVAEKHAGAITPAGLLRRAQARGLPNVTREAGRSVARRYKPRGFGMPAPQAINAT